MQLLQIFFKETLIMNTAARLRNRIIILARDFISIKTGVRAWTFTRLIRERNGSPKISLVKRPGFYFSL